jgi:magnesium and cobalt transporter
MKNPKTWFQQLKKKLCTTGGASNGVTPDVFSLHKLQIRDALIPRADMQVVSEDASMDDVVTMCLKQTALAVPVCRGDLDHIIGVIYVPALLDLYHRQSVAWKSAIRSGLFASPAMTFWDAFDMLRKKKQGLLIVVDEHGGVDGMVTQETLVACLLEKTSLEKGGVGVSLHDRTFPFFEGRFSLERFEEIFPNHKIPLDANVEDDITTLGGLVCHLAGRVPQAGESIRKNDLTFKVIDADPRKINRLKVIVADSEGKDIPS